MLRQAGPEGLEAGHMGPMAERDAPKIALHMEYGSVRQDRTFQSQFTDMEPNTRTQILASTQFSLRADSPNTAHRHFLPARTSATDAAVL
jgi:hypothetical protein